ncbi:MAG: (2Fe-2S)-binding protein [Caulobacterales bacterium]|jgi:bacterioferritin-associated ferredoxin
MIVCNCNGVRCREVDEAIARGARSPKAVLKHHGHEPQCCRCLKDIAARIKSDKPSPLAAAQIAAE